MGYNGGYKLYIYIYILYSLNILLLLIFVILLLLLLFLYFTDAANASCYKFGSSETVMVSASLGDGCVCNNGIFSRCLWTMFINLI